MSGHWWRAYDEAVDDPKLILLSDKAHRAWFNLMCLASAYGGVLPPIEIVVVKLRMTEAKVGAILEELVSATLLDEFDGKLRPHNWNGRQYQSDVSTPRVKRFRERQRNVSVTPPDTDTDTDTERKNKEDTADAVPSPIAPYAFESGIIRLSQKDFDRWKQGFSHLDLRAELLSLSQWAEEQGSKWFHAVSGALAKRNRELGLRLEQQNGPQKRPFDWREAVL